MCEGAMDRIVRVAKHGGAGMVSFSKVSVLPGPWHGLASVDFHTGSSPAASSLLDRCQAGIFELWVPGLSAARRRKVKDCP